ncbi:hypothetical protein [Nonomuraea aurantiaca]|uniref:hypothetical protein n=1 Tax=Nonomuraea aurantiaca TaxID=2878562 RepID=UPI001CDA05DD|nr:hypothetical protein [Nonomuraea aurantiaca]MCA2219671.1 hypothetical protein [Nonomuraea aurantiaca]
MFVAGPAVVEALKAEIAVRLEAVRSPFRTAEAFFIMANSRVAQADASRWRRHFTLMLDALRPAPPAG